MQWYTGSASWGYLTAGSGTATNGATNTDPSRSIRYQKDHNNLVYQFDGLDAGTYDAHVGFYDPWYQYSQGNRLANVKATIVGGSDVGTGFEGHVMRDYGTEDVVTNIAVESGNKLQIVITPKNSGDSTDMQVSYLYIVPHVEENPDEGPFTVTFNTQGGSHVDSQTVAKNGKVTRPVTDPTKTGVTFQGWYTNAAGTGDAYDFNTPVTGNLILFAKWSEPAKVPVSSITVKNGDTPIADGGTVKVYINEDHVGHTHNHSLTLTAQVNDDATNKVLNWTRPAGAQGMITLNRTAAGDRAVITAVTDEKKVGEVNVEVASASDPDVKVTFTVQIIRILENDVSISVRGVNDPTAAPQFGRTLEADINQLKMTTAGKAALTYQWKRNGTAISGATAKTYTINAKEDVGAIISVDVTADETTFYEGTRSATRSQAVEKADGPAQGPSGLTGHAPSTDVATDGTITGFGTDFANYEYKAENDTTWTAVRGQTINDLAPGNYQVRAKETDTHKAGAAVTVTVPQSGVSYHDVKLATMTNGNVTRSASQAVKETTVTLTMAGPIPCRL